MTPEAMADPWMQPRGVEVEPEPETLDAEYGRLRGHALTPDDALAADTRFDEAEVASVLKAVGIASAQSGLSAETGEAMVDVVSSNWQPPVGGTHDPDRGLSELRRVIGPGYEKVIEKALGYTASWPALRALLEDESCGLLGNHPKVVMALAAMADGLLSPQGAQNYLDAIRTPGSPEAKEYFGKRNQHARRSRTASCMAAGHGAADRCRRANAITRRCLGRRAVVSLRASTAQKTQQNCIAIAVDPHVGLSTLDHVCSPLTPSTHPRIPTAPPCPPARNVLRRRAAHDVCGHRGRSRSMGSCDACRHRAIRFP